MALFKQILMHIIAFVFKPFPRRKNLWVTGKVSGWEGENKQPAFFDNSKYLYLYLVNNTNENVFWISSSDEEIRMLKDMGLPVVPYPSIKAIFLTVRAKFFFHHYGKDQIDGRLQYGSVQINLWHGTPLKKIGYDIMDKAPIKHNIYLDYMRKGEECLYSSTSRFLSREVLKGAFAANEDQFLNFGYPRTDILRFDKEKNRLFCEQYAPDVIAYIDICSQFEKVFLYMPTWRDNDPDYFEKANINYDYLSKKLKEIGGVIFVKLHPLTHYTEMKQYGNIYQIGNDVDIYPFLQHVDYLITDYSSIYFDFLLLNREIIFIPYDYDEYVGNRQLYFDYDDFTPGKKYYSFNEFAENLDKINQLNYSRERDRIRRILIENYKFDACERIYDWIVHKYK